MEFENSKEIDPEQERLEVPQDKSNSGDIGDAEECPAPAVTEGATLSKSQMKKQLKKQKWEQVKSAKRKAEKQRQKARKQACRERGEDVGPTRKKLRHNKMSKSNCRVKVVVDCDFDDYMAEKDIKMLVKQIQYSYSANRRAENPLQFYCCGVTGKTRQRLESIGDYKGWDIIFSGESYIEKFEKSSIVYLSSESENILHTLEDDKVYIIGGLVDHNHHKGLCHTLAKEKGISHAQLPISDYIDMKTRKVLTVNHVFEILLHYTETKDWQKALYTVLPPRKGAALKQGKSSEKADNSSDKQDNSSEREDNSSEKEDKSSDKEDNSEPQDGDSDNKNACSGVKKDNNTLNTGTSKHCENGKSESLKEVKDDNTKTQLKKTSCENDDDKEKVEDPDGDVIKEEKDIVTLVNE
ncbi:tRNA methyltransferase 10 homolog A-like [Ruditapes philippinarum]|uniref:tRNA methyltransferase 10 homolog A-like n=1 Tax=Ruditapes philippinarum TaxID=129788 RepID=UPI00295BF426|nr:tRNA methyltransferase 10 homolog A-like [Ruditapes philippinarum]